MSDLEKAAEQFFDKWMPIYGMIVCLMCFLMLAAMAVGIVWGGIQRLFS